MDATQYWPFAREYAIGNVAVSALKFWMEDLEPHTLSVTIERFLHAIFAANPHNNYADHLMKYYTVTS